MRRASTRQWTLKPQDLAVVLKLVTLNGGRISYAALAAQMRLSQFEVHAAVQRLTAAKLVVERDGAARPNMEALRAFVINGALYAYPPVRGEKTIGFPTAHAAAPLKGRVLASKDSMPVWPHPEGPERGEALLPLYSQLPLAASDDEKLAVAGAVSNVHPVAVRGIGSVDIPVGNSAVNLHLADHALGRIRGVAGIHFEESQIRAGGVPVLR